MIAVDRILNSDRPLIPGRVTSITRSAASKIRKHPARIPLGSPLPPRISRIPPATSALPLRPVQVTRTQHRSTPTPRRGRRGHLVICLLYFSRGVRGSRGWRSLFLPWRMYCRYTPASPVVGRAPLRFPRLVFARTDGSPLLLLLLTPSHSTSNLVAETFSLFRPPNHPLCHSQRSSFLSTPIFPKRRILSCLRHRSASNSLFLPFPVHSRWLVVFSRIWGMFDEIAPGFILRLLLTPRSRIASRVKL